MYGYIYKTTNLINNMIYVGQHKAQEFNPKYLGSGKLILRAIKLHGKENFKVELLEEISSSELMDEREQYWVAKFNCLDKTIGYNISRGGQKRFFTGQKHDKEARKKMSDRAKKRAHPPTTAGRISVTNGIENRMIDPSNIDSWIEKGWYKGKTLRPDYQVWNKDLTKETDPRLAVISENRKRLFEERGQIGCYGEKGNQHGFKKGGHSWNTGSHETTHNLSLKNKEKNK